MVAGKKRVDERRMNAVVIPHDPGEKLFSGPEFLNHVLPELVSDAAYTERPGRRFQLT
jgi:hypothetical protein